MTHRAFCDALAEETARVTAASNMHNPLAAGNNMNYHFIGAPLEPNMAQHFSSLFKPVSSNNNNENSDPMRRDQLSLWNMGVAQEQEQIGININNLREIHQIGPVHQTSAPALAAVYDTNALLQSRSNPPPVSYNHNIVNWDQFVGSKISSINNAEQLSNTSSANISVPSLFSTQHQSHQQIAPSSTANMSATALLQKAAQIGATTTTAVTDPSIFLGNFGMNNCSSNKNNNHLQQQQGDNNKFCGFYLSTTNNSISTSLGSEVDHSSSVNDFSATMNQMQMYPPSKRRHIQIEDSVKGGGGQTRDFLGVGVQSICRPSTINGWI